MQSSILKNNNNTID